MNFTNYSTYNIIYEYDTYLISRILEHETVGMTGDVSGTKR